VDKKLISSLEKITKAILEEAKTSFQFFQTKTDFGRVEKLEILNWFTCYFKLIDV